MPAGKTAIYAKPNDANMVAGPLSLGLVFGGPAAFGIACLFWKPDEIIDHWEALVIFAVIFVMVFASVRLIGTRLAFWRIENGEVYRGKKLLFRLADIEAIQVGLTDNWFTAFSRSPIQNFGPSGVAIATVARDNIIIVKLTHGRWFMWNGFLYQGYESFRDALVAAAPQKSIDEVPESILPQLQPRNLNRMLTES